ncbi:MAG: hypothetical protein QM743_06945 [Chitinophagaceae bacterium]
MLNITSIGPRDVIHCSTLSEFEAIAALMRDANMHYPPADSWQNSKADTCIQPNGNTGYHGYFFRHGYNIIPAAVFLPAILQQEIVPVAAPARTRFFEILDISIVIFFPQVVYGYARNYK